MEPLNLIRGWLTAFPYIETYAVVTGIDICMGLTVAFGKQQVNSAVSRLGIAKKAACTLIVALGFALQRYTPSVSLGDMFAAGFAISESISIVENAGKLGLTTKWITDALPKINGGKAPPIEIKLTSDASDWAEKIAVAEDIKTGEITDNVPSK